MKKKVLSLVLALVMCLGLTVPAFATGEPGSTTVQDNGGFSYTLSKPVVGTRVDNQYGTTYYQISEGTIITPVIPEGTVKEVKKDEDVTKVVYTLPNEEGIVLYDVCDVYSTPYGTGTGILGDLEGMLAFDGATPTQPLRKEQGNLVIMRFFSKDFNSYYTGGDSSKITYLYFEIVPDSGSATVTTTVGGFTDVKTGDYFADPVKWAVEKSITSGTSATTFSPTQNCTVAQILTFLWRANGSPKPTGSNPFSDVKSGDYYADAAVWAYEKGIVSGTAFVGNTPCTRAMAVTYMWKAAGSPSAKAASFADVSAGAEYASAVAWAVEKGVTAGTSATTFSPDNVCTRGQIVTFLYRGLAK